MPTLFKRKVYLRQCLESVRDSGDVYVILMGPDVQSNSKEYVGLFDQLFEEPSRGNLSSKLNLALDLFPEQVDLITWIGDDDLLASGAMTELEKRFRSEARTSLVFGVCEYIDSNGDGIGKNKNGIWALRIARWGPFLAPQPGSLFRRTTFREVGGLDSSFDLAFDFDLFLALSKKGKALHTRNTVASFRWHDGSLSVGSRDLSVAEASKVRVKHAPTWAYPLLKVLNPLIEKATLLAGRTLSRYLKKIRYS